MNSLRHQKNSMAQNGPCATKCPKWRTGGATPVQNSTKVRSQVVFQGAPPVGPQWRTNGATRNAPPPPPALYRNGGASGAHTHPISAGPKVGRRCREQHPAMARGLALFQKHTAAAAAAITKQPSARSELSPWKIRDRCTNHTHRQPKNGARRSSRPAQQRDQQHHADEFMDAAEGITEESET